MRKTILILILCAPLIWLTCSEGLRLRDVSDWSLSNSKQAEGEDHPKPEDVAKAKSDAAAIINLPEGVTATIIRLDPPSPGASDTDPLQTAMVEHAQERVDKTEVVVRARNKGTDIKKRIEEILQGMLGPDGRPANQNPKLKDELDAYEKEVHDPDLVASARAEWAWPDLESNHGGSVIDGFYKLIDQWLAAAPDQSTAEPAELEVHADAYRKYLKDHETAKGSVAVGLAREARDRLALLERAAKLVTLLRDSSKRGIEQLNAIVGLDDNNPPQQFRKSLRHVVRVLCEALLKREPYDDTLKLSSSGSPAPEPVQRKDVQVVLKSGETVPLGNGEAVPPGTQVVDEYSLKADQVESFILPGESRDPPGPGISPLKGTEYSDGIRAYNTERDRIKEWSASALQTLQETCVQHEAGLKQGGGSNLGGQTLITRINGLLEIVRRHPSLFVAN